MEKSAAHADEQVSKESNEERSVVALRDTAVYSFRRKVNKHDVRKGVDYLRCVRRCIVVLGVLVSSGR